MKKVETACLLALFLLPGILFAVPILSSFHVTAYSATTPKPSTVVGATATIDYPIYASVTPLAATADQRVITVTNPAGNPGITTITISVPAAAVSAAPAGTIPTFGGVPDCAGVACAASVFGSGPYSLQYQDTSAGHSGAVILPGGASIELTLTIHPEDVAVSGTTTTSAADSFQFSVAVTDTVPSNTVLSAINVYETTATGVTLNNPLPATSQTAGTGFTFSATVSGGTNGAQSGIALNAELKSVACASPPAVNCPSNTAYVTPPVTPKSYTSTTGAQTFTASDIQAETVSIQVGGPTTSVNDVNGLLTNGTMVNNIAVQPGSVVEVSTTISGETVGTNVNETVEATIPGAQVVVSTTDKYGNAAPFSNVNPTDVTLTASTLVGQQAGFTSHGAYNFNPTYPFAPADLATTATVIIAAGTSTGNLGSTATPFYWFGPDYGSTSEIEASATGLSTTTSSKIVTWAFQATAPAILVGDTNVVNGACGAGCNLGAGTATPVIATLPTAQAGVTVYFWLTNTSDYSGLFSNGERETSATTTAATGNNTAYATVTLNPDTTVGDQAKINAAYLTLPYPSPQNSTGAITGNAVTVAGTFASLTVQAYFDAAQKFSANATTASGELFLDVTAADAYGNALTVASGTVQISLSTTSGALSTSTAYITAGHNDITSSNYQVEYIGPATSGASATISATGVYSAVQAKGSQVITIVTDAPTVVYTSVPTGVTPGTPQSITGWANVSLGEKQWNAGLAQGDKIVKLIYSWDLGTYKNVTLAAGAAANQFTITSLLNTTNILTVYAEDSSNVWTVSHVSIPALPLSKSFAWPTPSYYLLGNTYHSVNVTITNDQDIPLSGIVFAVIQLPSGQSITTSSFSNLAAGATVTEFPVLSVPAGTYSVQVFVFNTQGASESGTTTTSITVP
jgi:hypothetical protein